MSKKAHKEIYCADFETSNEIRNGIMQSWVWVGGYSRVFTNEVHKFGTIDKFVKSLEQNRSKKVYFHNLKFDGQFLLYYYIRKGFTYSDKLNEEKQMNYIIDSCGQFYALTCTFKNATGKIQRITYLDSLKLYPYSLRALAKQFNFDVQKGEMDYNKIRYKNHILTPEENDYFEKDIIILRTAIEYAINHNMNKMTIGANALSDYKEILENGGIAKHLFDKIFPQLSIEEDTYLRKSYRGGCCMVKKGMENKITTTNSYDVNSMYPSVLMSCKMPYGKPHYFKGKYKHYSDYEEVYVQHIKCSFYIKPKKLPCIQLKNNRIFMNNEWIENSSIKQDLYLTNIDLDLFFENYDVEELEYIDGYSFKCVQGLFSEYIDKWYTLKSTTKDKGEKAYAKLFLNNLYGKFGTNPLRKSARICLDEDGILSTEKYVEETTDTIYIPIAIFTTSYARYKLISNAQKNYDLFIYCDTDSIHTIKPINNIPIDNKKLGYFKYEYCGKGLYLKQKCYMIKYDKDYCYTNEDGEYVDGKVVCSGLNQTKLKQDGVVLDFDNFKIGAKFKTLKQIKCVGGCYLKECDHEIR